MFLLNFFLLEHSFVERFGIFGVVCHADDFNIFVITFDKLVKKIRLRDGGGLQHLLLQIGLHLNFEVADAGGEIGLQLVVEALDATFDSLDATIEFDVGGHDDGKA